MLTIGRKGKGNNIISHMKPNHRQKKKKIEVQILESQHGNEKKK